MRGLGDARLAPRLLSSTVESAGAPDKASVRSGRSASKLPAKASERSLPTDEASPPEEGRAADSAVANSARAGWGMYSEGSRGGMTGELIMGAAFYATGLVVYPWVLHRRCAGEQVSLHRWPVPGLAERLLVLIGPYGAVLIALGVSTSEVDLWPAIVAPVIVMLVLMAAMFADWEISIRIHNRGVRNALSVTPPTGQTTRVEQTMGQWDSRAGVSRDGLVMAVMLGVPGLFSLIQALVLFAESHAFVGVVTLILAIMLLPWPMIVVARLLNNRAA